MKLERDSYILSTGRRISANRGILGITASAHDAARLFEGYDGDVTPSGDSDDVPFSSDERHEIADFMIALWQAWAVRPSQESDR